MCVCVYITPCFVTCRLLGGPDATGERHRGLTLHNALVLTRVYPNGTRVFSSNYDPFTMWAAGELLILRRRGDI